MGKWPRRMLTLVMLGGTLSVAVLFGLPSFQTWSDQRDQRAQAEQQAERLDAEIAHWEREVSRRTSEEAVRLAALCFGPYVEPGTEVYAVPGLKGCTLPSNPVAP